MDWIEVEGRPRVGGREEKRIKVHWDGRGVVDGHVAHTRGDGATGNARGSR